MLPRTNPVVLPPLPRATRRPSWPMTVVAILFARQVVRPKRTDELAPIEVRAVVADWDATMLELAETPVIGPKVNEEGLPL